MKFALTLMFFSFAAMANPICDSQDKLHDIVYGNFLGVNQNLEYGYVSVYKAVSERTKLALVRACQSGNPTVQETTNALQAACLKECDTQSKYFFTGLLDTKSNQQKLKNECSVICQTTISTLHHFSIAQEK